MGPFPQLGWQTSAFGRAVERLLLTYGSNVVEQQTQLKRIADIAIELYALSAVLSRATRYGPMVRQARMRSIPC